MDMSNLAVFRMTTGKMSWLAERQRVLSQNIANSDTPEYKPRDMKEVDFRNLVKQSSRGVSLNRTHKSHMSLGSERFKFEIKNTRDMYETAPSGNAVILEQQLIKNAETVTDFQLMTNLYRKNVSMFKMALGGGKGQ